MDLDDLLEDLVEDAAEGARRRAREARNAFERRRRLPGVRRRMRQLVLYGSAGWVATFGGLGIAAELATTEPIGTVFALLFGGIALPAVGSGIWAWRSERTAGAEERTAAARRAAKQERADMPADVAEEWVRLRKAQALVADLATEGLVDEAAVTETDQMVEQLRVLLVADRRASELGATPSAGLRDQLGEVADLLVALAVEAVEHRSTEVGAAGGAATLVDGIDRLASLRAARAEVARAEAGDGAVASAWIDREVAERGRSDGSSLGPGRARPTREPDPRSAGDDEDRRQQPG